MQQVCCPGRGDKSAAPVARGEQHVCAVPPATLLANPHHKACPAAMHSPGRPPLLLMITPCHHCTRMHTALALSH
eukprot:scaffold141140_cov229-Phaeocystis_antarctica.AAC.1